MAYNYRCQLCNCRLDPNEGRICDECREILELLEEEKKLCFATEEDWDEILKSRVLRGA